MLRIVWESSVIFVFVVLACAIEIQLALSQDPSRHPLGGKSTRPNDRTRRIQSWMIKQKAVPKTRSLGKNTRSTQSTSNKQGSLLTFQKPTKANIGRWFGVEEDPGNLRSMLRREFNHGKHENGLAFSVTVCTGSHGLFFGRCGGHDKSLPSR